MRRRRGRGEGETGRGGGGEFDNGVVEERCPHDDFEREGVALQGDFVHGFGRVGCEVAVCGHVAFGEGYGERIPRKSVAEPT